MNQPSFISMWMKVFAASQSLIRRRSHKSSRFLPLNGNNGKEIQSVEASDRSLSHHSFSENSNTHTRGLTHTRTHTHTHMDAKLRRMRKRQKERAKRRARARSIAKNREEVLKSVFWVEFFVEKFPFDFYFPPCIDPTSKHKSWLTLFARSWRWRQQHQQKQNEIALVENGKIYRKKTL